MENPLVSIIIPCFNLEDYIIETLRSAVEQTYKYKEIIVVNDGSTDRSEEIIKKFITENPSVKYLDLENGGVSRARNIGINFASGSIILPLDGDDLISPEYTSLAVEEFQKDPDLIIVTGQGKFFGKEEGDWDLEDFTMKKMLHGNVIYCPSFFKKSDWKKVGGYDETMSHLEDWEFFIRLTSLNPDKVKRLNHRTYLYRIKEENSRNSAGFDNGSYNDSALYIYTKNKNLFFQHYGNPSLMIKKIEELNWENKKKERELHFLKKFCFNKILLSLREKKHRAK